MIRRTPKGYTEIEEVVQEVVEPFQVQMKYQNLTLEVVNKINEDSAGALSSYMAEWDMFC